MNPAQVSLVVLALLPVLLLKTAAPPVQVRSSEGGEMDSPVRSTRGSKHHRGEAEPSLLPQDQQSLFQPGCSFSWKFWPMAGIFRAEEPASREHRQ